MSITEDAFKDLFPEKNPENFELKIRYHNKFKPYNANVKYRKNFLFFNLSKKWKTISKDIQIGLIQELMLKAFRERKKTINIDLYNNFMKSLHISIPKTNTDPILENSFDKVNEKYFLGLIERPNLTWHNSLRRLGSYEYGTDTISISEILLEDTNLLDYVMYHEMLHKKHKFHNNNGRNHHHTHEFRKMEKMFGNADEMENRIKKLVRHKSKKRFILF
jgi:hypothetical protein